LLDEPIDDERIPMHHRVNPVRIPFKIDCRDFALWLNKKNPFSADEGVGVPAHWQKSLEAFLSAQVSVYSGGVDFLVTDLHAVTRLSAILLVFDGLDEVADIATRREVIEEIRKGIKRLDDVSLSLQTIITSRPAAFANSPGLPEEEFRYLNLGSITRSLIDEYAEKWLKARKLDSRDAADVRRILKGKLDQPHLRELARNPMQLAILLTLIHTRGSSLPDKRTALYDSYVDLFFDREAEKSATVRDHRDLLINIHRYLAWILHSEAQTDRNRGSVSADRLNTLVRDYLRAEGHDETLAQELFTGMVERVVALVSRVEGTYEFEVQPLREYFAARHLYDTAPYSPPGKECAGTKPDRFDAIARDFFWQNVTRFFAGCYSKGELPSLVDRLEDLSRAPGYKHTSHPQSLAATLLSDWVFAQDPKSMRKVVALILDGLGLRFLTSGGVRFRRGEPYTLPKKSGNDELVDRCWSLLQSEPALDYALMLVELLRANASRTEITARWLNEALQASNHGRTRWIEYGLYLGSLSEVPQPQLHELISDNPRDPDRLVLILRSGQKDILESDESLFNGLVDQLLDTSTVASLHRRPNSLIESFSHALSPLPYSFAFQSRQPLPLSTILREGPWPEFRLDIGESLSTPKFEEAEKCVEFIAVAQHECERPSVEWATEIGPWNTVVERGRSLFEDRWSLCVLANASAGVRSKDETCEDSGEFRNQELPLCRRARYARLRAGQASWWERQLADATDHLMNRFTLLVFLTWAGPSVLTNLADVLDGKLLALSSTEWDLLANMLQFGVSGYFQDKRELSLNVGHLPAELCARTAFAMSTRVNDRSCQTLFDRYLRDYDGSDKAILEFRQRMAYRSAKQDPKTWSQWLPMIAASYAKGAISDHYFAYRYARLTDAERLPSNVAEGIVQEAGRYPTDLVSLADESCRQRVASKLTPVGIVAANEGWFNR
jgi:hypothetical protein